MESPKIQPYFPGQKVRARHDLRTCDFIVHAKKGSILIVKECYLYDFKEERSVGLDIRPAFIVKTTTTGECKWHYSKDLEPVQEQKLKLVSLTKVAEEALVSEN